MSEIEWTMGAPAEPEVVPGVRRFPVGVLLDVRDRGLILIGHVNELEGVCNDCSAEIDRADIERHAFVWTEGES